MQWNVLDSDLGYLNRGDIVEVTLTAGANVMLLDSSNFSRYKRGDRYDYHGGLVRRRPLVDPRRIGSVEPDPRSVDVRVGL
jgi:hypothetical protein